MKVLLGAFAYSPILGSECGIGWHWSRSIAKKHDVTVLAHAWFKPDVEAALAADPVPNLKVEYFHVDPFWTSFKRSHLDSQLYILYWQYKVTKFAKQLHRQHQYDLVHHLTHGTIRYPSWLGFLGAPYIAGPVGGGERAPMRFYRGLPWRARLYEVLRDIVLFSFQVDPFAQVALAKAKIIFCRTGETIAAIPRYMRHKTVLAHEVAAPPVKPRIGPVPKKPRTTLLYAGRLTTFKGLHLAIPAMAEAFRKGADIELIIIGEGELSPYLHELAEKCKISERLTFVPRVPQQELYALYQTADAFLFSSLHDSGANVVVESMSRGLPVLCLDLGVPRYFIDESCGRVVKTQGVSQAEVISRLAQAICEFHETSQATRQSMHDEAIRRAARMTWDDQVNVVYSRV